MVRPGEGVKRSDYQQLLGLLKSPPMPSNAISGFAAVVNPASQGVDVNFTLSDTRGVSLVSLLRAFTQDLGQATIVQTWAPKVSTYSYSDTDKGLQASENASYWIELTPVGVSGKVLTNGPQTCLLNPQLAPPLPCTGLSISWAPPVNGYVKFTANVTGIPVGGSVQIELLVTVGAAHVLEAVAQSAKSPLQFEIAVANTHPSMHFYANAISPAGVSSALGHTVGLTVTIAYTAGLSKPASPQGVVVTQIAGGNQISWPANLDGVTSYTIYRGQQGGGFVGATMLATAGPNTGTLVYLDTGGLSGNWEYYITATNATGESLPSPASTPAATYSSALLPPNVPVNTTNNATVDSIISGSSALARIYGPGGVGTSYTHYAGYGTLTRPNGLISGLTFATYYYVLYQPSTLSYIATTSYTGSLPDGYEYVGYFETCASGSSGGSGATAVAVINSGAGTVIQINSTANGTGYVSGSVTVSIAGGGGSGATATATVSAGGVVSYTITNGGSGYLTAPTVTITSTSSAGTPGGGGTGGGDSGGRSGCVLEGTPVIAPNGTEEELLPETDWVRIDYGGDPLFVAPGTLVSVFKRADELTNEDRIESMSHLGSSVWESATISKASFSAMKVKRRCPGGVYHAASGTKRRWVRLHNVKPIQPD